ncbi:nitrate reductase molybdenum cofactor assembly chaperone [Paenarthrobacter sp. DKR-5]|uniref:nitrate reductase molybdenum cofactor assembly chaperone n=1 Tax=Paenarthrobacter sp. DKR-5 TaxID=2835535 RepID=UPI001BDBF404|nr:nitrate reductase molybdenum cofactor assembly chaperone [Paenarthrobacter sp. DKR-5]MBT1001110.1 nitrate reductase molybdenum cofactor assembly chaperone [Paenarthrobacter sp. DKR-5]
MASDSQGLRVFYQVTSICLSYPDEQLPGRVPLLRQAAAGGAGRQGRALLPLLEHLGNEPLSGLQRRYVDTFDLTRKHALYLSYWTDGDTRRRGEALAGFKQAYRDSGFLVDTHGELPDYLPMVLEFAAVADLGKGTALLQQYRAGLELLRLALGEAGSPYAAAVEAVCSVLPGPSPADRHAVMKLAGYGPPRESVGLDPYDPRLLPLTGGS